MHGQSGDEVARERIVHKYYQLWLHAQETSETGDGPRCQDKVLSSFAQLAALRLQVKRGMISLLDTENQYVLCDETPTGPPAYIKASDNEQAHGCLSGAVLPQDYAVCRQVFLETFTVLDNNECNYTTSAFITPDLQKHALYKDRPFVKSGAFRFFAAVPIKTGDGIALGALAVASDTPRPVLNYEELVFLEELADTVFQYLEKTASQTNRFRGDSMLRGLARFVKGLPTYDQSDDPNPVGTKMARLNFASDVPPQPKAENRNPPVENPSAHNDSESKGDFQRARENIMHRASKGTCTSMNADGVLFLDTSLIDKSMYHEKKLKDEPALQTATAEEGSTKGSVALSAEQRTSHWQFAKVLSLSVSERCTKAQPNFTLSLESLARAIREFPYGGVFYYTAGRLNSASTPAQQLDKIGITPSVTNDGGISDSRRRIERDIASFLPDAKRVIFLPLWDYVFDRCFAAEFVWTDDDRHLPDPEYDMPLLKLFGDSIISQAARLDTKITEKAKTTFVESISHELRSPLHGIIGSTEFLRDTAVDSFQSGLITAIDTCGKTLLDTMDHLLDFAEINSAKSPAFEQADVLDGDQIADIAAVGEMGLVADFDLAILVEEVCEALFAGQTFRKQRMNNHEDPNFTEVQRFLKKQWVEPDKSTTDALVDASKKYKEQVFLVLRAMYRESWCVRSQPGAMRRIVMNLLGNALKYTTRGYVSVSLNFVDHPQGSTNHTSFNMVFEDTGKGISPTFLQDHLFSPFHQEDSFYPGTGLGLSIVKQLIQSLGGDIKVQSRLGIGTTVTVSLSLPTSSSSMSLRMRDHCLKFPDANISKLKLCLLDPTWAKINQRPPEFTRSFIATCQDWLGIEVFRSSTEQGVIADFLVYAEPPPLEYLIEHFGKTSKNTDRANKTPLIIVCTNSLEASALKSGGMQSLPQLGPVIDIIAMPVGPRKLAQVLQQPLRKSPDPTLKEERTSRTSPDLSKTLPSTLQESTADRSLLISSPEKLGNTSSKDAQGSQVLASLAESDVPKSGAVHTEGLRKSHHVLIVDDNSINLKLLAVFMRRARFTYQEAMDGLQAFEAYKSNASQFREYHNKNLNDSNPPQEEEERPFDYIIMDISMPVMDGLESTRSIRRYEMEKKLKPATIIALTGLGDEATQIEAKNSGVDHYFTKPLKFKDLTNLLY